MAAGDKDTIYVDIDDEITAIIDKVRSSDSKVVALVLPKRATVFQSIVNMKLLKRAAESSKKNLVLITSEAGLLPLAGAAGVHVAKTLTSKPEIPSAPKELTDTDDEDEIAEDGEELEPDPNKPVGELAAAGAAGAVVAGAAKDKDGMETLVLDDEDVPPEADNKPAGPKTFEPPKKGKGKKNKKLAVPNFERFRLLLILGGLAAILLIGGLIYAIVAMPKATIAIKTDATAVDVGLDLNLSTTAKTVDQSENTIPAKQVSQQKTYSQQVPTTGQKNNGNKASGSVTLTNCTRAEGQVAIPAGTGLSSGGNTYITQETVVLPESNFTGGGRCTNNSKGTVQVLAQNPGTAYNGANSFTVAGFKDVSGSAASSITGGTDNIVQTVNQNDINNAKAKISSTNDEEMKKTLQDQLKGEQYYPIPATFVANTPTTTTSANVGDVATSVTVTETITYTMFGVEESDLETLVEADIRDQIDDEQSILDNGIASAVYTVDTISNTGAKVTMTSKASAGPDLDVEAIKENAAGKKAGQVKSDLSNNPDVTDVQVELSPFWVSSIPNKVERITVEIAKPTDTKANSSDGNN